MNKQTKTLTFKLLEPQPDGVNRVAAALPIVAATLVVLVSLLIPGGVSVRLYGIVAGVVCAVVAVLEFLIFRERRRLLATHLELDSEGVSCLEGDIAKWRAAWSDVQSVELRWYLVQVNHYHQALVFRLKNGRKYLIPTSSHLYGKMPHAGDLIKLIGRSGFEVETAYWPLSLAPKND